MVISQRCASTVFDRFNFTIIDIIDFTDPIPTVYTAEDFFTFYEVLLNFDESQPNWGASVQYMFLLGINSYLGSDTSTENGTGSDEQLSRLQEFLAAPIFLFNNVNYGGPTPGLNGTASLAVPSYRVLPKPFLL